jgi:hypothetical protein
MRPFRWLGWFALAVIIGHHVGTIFGPLGELGRGTEWADWIDLLVPYAVVGTSLAVLAAARADRRSWLLAAAGAIAYVEGHGIHLSSNSIGNARGPSSGTEQPVHLWDEVVGHYLWYAGLFLLVAALARTLASRPRPAAAATWPLALLFGLTTATNGIEGGTPYFTLTASVAFVAYGWRHRRAAGLLLAAAYGLTALLLLGWGVYWALAEGRAFPQFSELGWI